MQLNNELSKMPFDMPLLLTVLTRLLLSLEPFCSEHCVNKEESLYCTEGVKVGSYSSSSRRMVSRDCIDSIFKSISGLIRFDLLRPILQEMLWLNEPVKTTKKRRLCKLSR